MDISLCANVDEGEKKFFFACMKQQTLCNLYIRCAHARVWIREIMRIGSSTYTKNQRV